MYAHASGTTVLHLAKEAVPSFEFPLPPHELVLNFDVLAGSALEQINILFSEISTLARLRDALLPQLVSGEIRLPDPEGLLTRLEAVT
jgi:type I restriction enzyme S subunit